MKNILHNIDYKGFRNIPEVIRRALWSNKEIKRQLRQYSYENEDSIFFNKNEWHWGFPRRQPLSVFYE